MARNIFKLNNRRNGSVLVFVLILFLIMSVIATSVAFMFSSNLTMASHQESNIRAHYLALSGVDVTISTLISIVEVDSYGIEKTMAAKIEEGNVDRELDDEIIIEGEKVKINLKYNNQDKEFTIKSSVDSDNLKKDLSLNIVFSGNSYKKRWN